MAFIRIDQLGPSIEVNLEVELGKCVLVIVSLYNAG